MPVLPTAIAVVLVGAVFLLRRADVRLVLVLCAAALFALRATQPEVAGQRAHVFAGLFVEFARKMVDPRAVVPICSAMGFAYVCKLTECDAHLVHLLCRPLRRVRWLLVPAGVAVAFLVNSAIVSQTSTVSVVGPVLVPLVLAAGFSRQTAGAILLLGGSMGGELLNPASVEIAAIKTVTGQDSVRIIRHILPYNLLACGTALGVFWLLTFLRERPRRVTAGEDCPLPADPAEDDEGPATAQAATIRSALSAPPAAIGAINPLKAAVPLVPIVLLLFGRRFLPLPAVLTDGKVNPIAEQATVAAAMLIGVAAAALSSPRKAGGVAAAFFEGAGFAYVHVISVIITAGVFSEGMRVNGLIERMAWGLKDVPAAVTVASVVLPWVLATVTGTAVGTAPLVIAILVPVAMGPAGHVAPGQPLPPGALAAGLRAGALNAVASQFGRTSSPVAPVVLMSAAISHARPGDLLKRVVPPLLAGGVALLIAAVLSG